MKDSIQIIRDKTHEDVSNTLFSIISTEISKSNNYNLGLSGGSTPLYLYKKIAEKFKENKSITVWTVDERHVELKNEYSNQGMINSIFQDTAIKLLSYKYYENPQKSAEYYSKLVLENIQTFNSAILGVGGDGHIASLFPFSNALNSTRKGFVETEVNILSKWRITSTFKLLLEIENIYILATGEGKKEILSKIGKDFDLPINKLLGMREKTIILTDQ